MREYHGHAAVSRDFRGRVMVKLKSARTVQLTRTPTNDAYVLSVDQATNMAVPA